MARAEQAQALGADRHRQGIYLPYWTFDAHVDASWTAEAGFYYYTTETYSDSAGRTQTRQVQHVRWEPASGRLQHFFDDDLICASVGVHASLLRGIEPFPTTELKPYDAGYVAGWVVERYQIDLVTAAKAARDDMDAKLRQLCAAEVMATPIATSRCARHTRARRSSTSSLPYGC